MLLEDDDVIMKMINGLLVRRHDACQQWDLCALTIFDDDNVGGDNGHCGVVDGGE